jgi:hypothetical protein
MSKPADTLGVSKVLLVMMIPFNVVGLFGCVSSMPRSVIPWQEACFLVWRLQKLSVGLP